MRATPMFLSFNDAQRHALDTRRNLAVRAGAGSGKTRVLVERIVQLLARSWESEAPLPLSSIVAVTFTRKAASELQERLCLSFRAMMAAASQLAEQSYWSGLIEEAPRAMIGTIDSLCARILREYGLHARLEHRLEPGFEMLEGYEEETLKREAIDRVIDRLMAAESQSQAALSQSEACRWWATTHGFDALSDHLHALLGSAVEPAGIVATHSSLPPVAERVQRLRNSLPGPRFLREHHEAVRQRLLPLIAAIERENKAGETLRKLGARFAEALGALNDQTFESDCLALEQLQNAFLRASGDPLKLSRGLGSLAEEIQTLQREWLPRLACIEIDEAGESAAAEAADRLALLLEPAHAEYLNLCREASRYDFLTIARLTRDLLRHTPPARQELRQRWRYVLVDEFQDTNALQWEIISWLVGAGPEGPLDCDRLFIVGDPQQSIYRFRGAEVTVFQRVQAVIEAGNRHHGQDQQATDYDAWLSRKEQPGIHADVSQRAGRMSLKENYRSLPRNLLDVVDTVMARVFDPEHNEVDLSHNRFETPHQDLKPGIKNEATGLVHYLLPAAEADAEETEEDAPGPSELQARAVGDELIATCGQPKLTGNPGEILHWRDMAVLLPSRTEALTALEKEFRRRRVPYLVHKGIGFWQRQEIRDVVSLTCCLADAGDELALFAVLRGPPGQLLDTEILFLSQLGSGSLRRGLRRIRQGAHNWKGEAPAEPQSFRKRARQEPRPPEAVDFGEILNDVWLSFTPERRERIERAAADLDRWRRRVDRMAHADLLQTCLEDSGAQAIYAAELDGDLALRNLARLWSMIREEEGARPLGLARLARRLRGLVDEATREEQASLADERDAVQVMTVHAAKGLEFPVVAVMRLEHQVVRRNDAKLLVRQENDPLLPNDDALPDTPAGTINVMIRHPLKPRQWFRPRLMHALLALDAAQQRAEERRLFYVAATRAQERLILVANEPRRDKDGQRRQPPESWQRWFEEALEISEEHIRRGYWENANAGQRIDIVTHRGAVEPAVSAATQECPPALDLAYVHELPSAPIVPITGPAGLEAMRQAWREDRRLWWLRFRAQLLPHVRSAVAFEAQSTEIESLGTVVGTIVHRLLQSGENLLGRESLQQERLIQAMASSLLTEGDTEDESRADARPARDTARVVQMVRAICRRFMEESDRAEPIRALLSAPGSTEVPFLLELAGWHMTGRFDKLMRTGDQVEIIDWKTDAEDSIAELTERHAPQMRLYALALWRSGRCAQGQECITVRLASLHQLQVAAIPFPLRELAIFEEAVCAELRAMAEALRSNSAK